MRSIRTWLSSLARSRWRVNPWQVKLCTTAPAAARTPSLACASFPAPARLQITGGDALAYFGRQALVNYALTPFKVTDTTDHFDVIATLNGGGISGQAGALRHGISRALLSAGDYRAELKKAGYLTRDSRMVERKKYASRRHASARSSRSARNSRSHSRTALFSAKPVSSEAGFFYGSAAATGVAGSVRHRLGRILLSRVDPRVPKRLPLFNQDANYGVDLVCLH